MGRWDITGIIYYEEKIIAICLAFGICYTKEEKEGRWRPTERTTTITSSYSQGRSYNSGSTSTSGSTGASIGTNTSASTNMSRTNNSGSSSSNKSNSNSQTTTTKEICVDKDKLPLYKKY